MKINNFFKTIFLLAALFVFATSCSETNNGGAEVKKTANPTVSVTAIGTEDLSIKFLIELKDASKAGYLVVAADDSKLDTFSEANMLKNATSIENLEQQVVTVDNLTPNTIYYIAAYAVGKDDATIVVSDYIEMHPKTMQTDLVDGFVVYDGVDEASGRHRVTFMGFTKDASDKSEDYIDVLLYMYTLNFYDAISIGTYEAFDYEGSNMNVDLLYKPGELFSDDTGANLSGSGWWTYSSDGDPVPAAANEGTHKISYDDETKLYTIQGTMIDSVQDKRLDYIFTTDKIWLPDWGN